MFQTYIKLLTEFVKFKSISCDKQYEKDINLTVDWLVNLFNQNSFKTKVYKGYDNPIIYATYEFDPTLPTVLIYGHYDVQNANKSDGWLEDPFKLLEKENKLYARGVVDNKGQTLIHIVNIFELINPTATEVSNIGNRKTSNKQNNLKYNIGFLLEGNEETGGEGISRLLKEKPNEFKADKIIISDGEIPYRPAITASFRGVFNISLQYKTALNSVHSGLYGGAVLNAGQELMKLITKLQETENYNKIFEGSAKVNIDKTQIENCKTMDKLKQNTLSKINIKKTLGGKYDSFCAQIGLFSMFTVTGFKTGYIDTGYLNSIPNTALAKLNFRIAFCDNKDKILENFKNLVKQNTPEYIEFEFLDLESMVDPVNVDLQGKDITEAKQLLTKIYGQECLIDYCGATLPIILDFKKYFKKDPMLINLGNDDCNMHGVNENFDIELIKKGLEFSREYFKKG